MKKLLFICITILCLSACSVTKNNDHQKKNEHPVVKNKQGINKKDCNAESSKNKQKDPPKENQSTISENNQKSHHKDNEQSAKAKQKSLPNQPAQTQVNQGIIPAVLKGVWKSSDGTISYTIGDNTFESGGYVYTITDVKIMDDSANDKRYQLDWDLDKYKSQYLEGKNARNINPQPIILIYHKNEDTLESGVFLYRQHE